MLSSASRQQQRWPKCSQLPCRAEHLHSLQHRSAGSTGRQPASQPGSSLFQGVATGRAVPRYAAVLCPAGGGGGAGRGGDVRWSVISAEWHAAVEWRTVPRQAVGGPGWWCD